MPSGAKKRKAAKKKKEKGANPTSTATSTISSSRPHGDEDLKHQESDGGEVSDHHNSEHHLTEGEEEEVEKKKEENREVVEEGVVQFEGESKQHDEFDKKKAGSSRSSSSSSSSDNESHVVEKDILVVDNASVVDYVEAVDSFSKEPNQLDNFAEKASVFDEKVVEDSGALAAKSSDLENGERRLSSLEVNGRLPALAKDLAPENRKDEATDAAATSEARESVEHESEEKLTVSYNPPRDDATRDAEHVKDSEVLGSSERQPLVASVVQPVQRTSWKGCCGLFELFTGSNA